MGGDISKEVANHTLACKNYIKNIDCKICKIGVKQENKSIKKITFYIKI